VAWAASASPVAHVFVEGLSDSLDLDGPEGHHLARVLRLRPGEVVTGADGRGRWRPYEVAAVSGAGVRLDARGPGETEPPLTPVLAVAFCLTKADKPDLTVQKLTELGVDRILPVLSARSVSRPEGARAEAAVRRWRRVALEAARQCRRSRLPEVAEIGPLAALSRHPGLVVADHGGQAPSGLGPPPGGELLVVVGPEGGLAPDEVEGLAPWARLGLGPLVLRAETAALAAAAVLSVPRSAEAARGLGGVARGEHS
jgi:16S rRNA (uracil1498-N3)-methyltransferase